MNNSTTVEQKAERELVVTRSFNAPPQTVFTAWTTPDVLKRWWAPQSTGMTLTGCDIDARAGGPYRFAFSKDGAEVLVFFGHYVEVVPGARLVWTNEEGEDGAVTTVTFEDQGGATLLTLHELYPSTEARDEAFAGMEGGTKEQFGQLDEVLAKLG